MIVTESNKEYHSKKHILSKSMLSNMSKNPRYFKWCLDNETEPTPSMILGSAFHKLVLEPEDFDKEFAVYPQCDRRTKQGKEIYAKFLENASDKQIISEEQYETICGMRDSVMSNNFVKKILENAEIEKSIYWTDKFTGVECKCRPDIHKKVKNNIVIVDLKSCNKADNDSITKDIVKFHYDLQDYMYSTGVSIEYNIPYENINFVFIFVEVKPPYLVNIVEADNTIFENGESKFREWIGLYKYCKKTNNWYDYNGFSNEINEIGLPQYMLNKKEE